MIKFFRRKTPGEVKIDAVFKKQLPFMSGKWFNPYDKTSALVAVDELTRSGLSLNDFARPGKSTISPIEYAISKLEKPKNIGRDYAEHLSPALSSAPQNVMILFLLMDAIKDYSWDVMEKDLDTTKRWFSGFSGAHDKAAATTSFMEPLSEVELGNSSVGVEVERVINKLNTSIEYAKLKAIAGGSFEKATKKNVL